MEGDGKMGVYVILNWTDGEIVNVVTDEDGNSMIFNTEEEATIYGGVELNENWKVVDLEEA